MTQARFTAAELAAACGGTWLTAAPAGTFVLNTDSRTIQSGECFIPIVGERFDGHNFLDSLPDGCVALAEQGRTVPENIPLLMVRNTTLAYQQIASFHRRRMKDLTVVGVTGSVGKTSVKEMLRAIFTEAAGEDAVVYTLGNTNNQIGVPQNLLRLTQQTRYAVIEMGTNHHGEIAPLSAAALPDAALINTIAACHLENLGDLNGVAQEKSAIFSGMTGLDALAVYPAECAGYDIIEKAAGKFRNLKFGAAGDVSARYLNGSLNGSEVELTFNLLNKQVTFNWELTGEHQAANAAAAAALASGLGIAPEVIAGGLSKTQLPGKRMKSEVVNGTTWINDAYNANPQSMQSSLQCIAENTAGVPLLLVLGDMLELGADEIAYHAAVLDKVEELFAQHNYTLFLLGERFGKALQQKSARHNNWHTFASLDAVRSAIAEHRQSGMTIYLKSSNGIGLGKIEAC